MRTTPNEVQMLQAIRDSQYQDGNDPIDNPVWTDDVCDPFGRSAGGIMTSLMRKGLAWSNGETCHITRPGMETLTPCTETTTMHVINGLTIGDCTDRFGTDSKLRIQWAIGAMERLRAFHEKHTGNVDMLRKIRGALFELYGLTG